MRTSIYINTIWWTPPVLVFGPTRRPSYSLYYHATAILMEIGDNKYQIMRNLHSKIDPINVAHSMPEYLYIQPNELTILSLGSMPIWLAKSLSTRAGVF